MEMRQIEYFRALASALNFTRAAKVCGVSQPSLTRAIQGLAEEFGGQLFHRDGPRTRLSELGAIVRPHLDRVYEQAHEAAALARSYHETERVRLRLGVMCTVAPRDLVQLLIAVRGRHPDIQLDICDSDGESVERQLRSGDLDAAIVGRPESEPRLADLHYLPLYREQFMIVSGPEHRLSALDAIRSTDLNQEAYLRRSRCEMADVAAKSFHNQGAFTSAVYLSDRDDWILAMAAAGLGFAFMPSRSISHTDVQIRPIVEPEFWRDVSLVTMRGRPHSAAAGALVHEAMRTPWMDDRALAVKQAAAAADSSERNKATNPLTGN